MNAVVGHAGSGHVGLGQPAGSVRTVDGPAISSLVAEAASGSSEAWARLVSGYGGRVFALVRSRCGDPELAEEVTQSVFATVAEKLGTAGAAGRYTEQGRFEAWLFRIAMNRVRDEARRRSRRAAAMTGLRLAGGDGSDGQADPGKADPTGAAGEVEAVRAALARLSASDREVIELRHHGQLSFAQIAEVLHEPVGTLLARHHRALKKLRTMMAFDSGAGGGEGEDGKERRA